ncbi:MAG: hypothetical protein H0U74_02195 [Bradymonadaceae bacterium]|nr:hypothetical protein [Lujinxingiaceae bacterium]
MNDWNSNNGGNDWNAPGAGQPPGQPQTPPAQPHGSVWPASDAPPPHIVNEATFGDVIDNAKLLLERSKGPLLYGWLIAAGVELMLVIMLIAAAIVLAMGVTSAGSGSLGLFGLASIGSFFIGLLGIVSLVLVNAVRTAFYRPMRLVMLHGPQAVPDVQTLIRMAMERAVNVLLVSCATGVVVMVGMLFCIVPGFIAAFLLLPAAYLAATRDDLDLVSAMKEAVEIAKANVPVLLACVVVLIGVGFAVGIFGAIINFAATMAVGHWGQYVAQIGQWGATTVVGYIGWIALGAAFITIDFNDKGLKVAK